jgi:arylsulfatase A-like enzyme
MKVLLLSAFSLFAFVATQAAEKTNVIYILADDLGYGDLSCYGQKKLSTPNIDRLATEGLKFTNHYSGNTVCTPSRAVLMTGMHSGRCHVRGNLKGENGAALEPEWTVLPEVFKAAGYATGGFGKWGLGQTNSEGAPNPLTHGFDTYAGWKSQMIAHTYYPSSWVVDGKEMPLDSETYVHDLIMEKAFHFIKENGEAGTPFFCYIPTGVPHAAMQAPAELHEKWRKKLPEFDKKIGKYGAGPDEECPDVINPIAGYAAMMENLDNQIGHILGMLEEMGIEENTLVMFSSDNGAHKEGGHDPTYWNSTGSLRGHKRDMHEGGIRTPMLARWPGTIEAGTTTDHLSCFQDILPTAAEIVGQPSPDDIDGISFLTTLTGEGKQTAHDYLYWEFCKGENQDIFSQAVRQGKWKAYVQAKKPIELYDLEKDPYEENDLAGSMPERVEEIKKIIADAHHPLPTQKKN